ncbi:RNA polymerase II-associated factor 1 homolog isoform X2 [Orussus abietinus]|nr:RNA polymerase II-associated factor 1 homolog isoform X2 [Orussus abietinus]XP_023290358.1 RNA polymerase II-associated factor 1 homolog isoform X2 [Orussus abietinus]
MPPPPGAVPPPPHVFGPVHTQVAPIQTWAHPQSWQWVTPQTAPLPPQTSRDIVTSTFQREMPLRVNYIRRGRFNHNPNSVYVQRNNFHRKNRRLPRFDQNQGQFDQAAYFGAAQSAGIGLEWQRSNFATPTTEALMNHVALSNHQIPPLPPGVSGINRHGKDTRDQEIKIEEVVVKKSKQRRPMSQSYPSRPWNREDAERALQIENEYNKTVKAQSLIIKFPDPDLNKDIVREFHPGIQNIHFQSPSGPRYCFIQMAENVNIDEAIKKLEEIRFGVGYLRVERKSLRDKDNPMPEEIDPYTLYIGNLPESVNVNEVKSKFPTAARVDVGHAQKMRNTRYAFMRYNSVDESISAYKEAHNLMWDTRSIIVRFRRQRGNTCLPGEPKPNLKKAGDEASAAAQIQKEHQNRVTSTSAVETPTSLVASITPAKTAEQQQPWTSQQPQIPSAAEAPPERSAETGPIEETMILTDIKEEPEDYEEMPNDIHMEEDMDDDDDDDDDDEPNESEEEEDDEDNEDEEDEEDDDEINGNTTSARAEKHDSRSKDEEPSDDLDQMFNNLESIAGDIGL